MADPDPKTSSVVIIEPSEPYPEGSPPDATLVVANVHPPQERTDAEHWQAQSEANLAAGGVLPGAAAYEPEEPVVEEEDAGLRDTKRSTGRKG